MILKTMWGKRAGDGAATLPELMVAWDEHCVECFREGFEGDCNKARLSWEDDLAGWRMVDIHVSDEAIRQAFKPAVTAGSVVPVEQEG